MKGGGGEYLALAHKLADEARSISLRHFRAASPIENKNKDKESAGDYDPVTLADKETEALLRREIRRHFPSHAIWGEEEGRAPSSEESCQSSVEWILDPIDGTRNFVAGALYWTVLIGARRGKNTLMGLCDHPFTGERFFASREGGAWLQTPEGASPIRTRPCVRLEEAVLGATTPNMFQEKGEREAFEDLRRRTRIQTFGGNAYFYGLLAAGWMDIVLESALTVFDVQPLIPIIEEAGGVMTDWRGRPLGEGGQVLACGDPALHAKILPILKSAARD